MGRLVALVIGSILLLSISLPVAGADAGEDAPDVIVVMVDDLGYIDDERVLERLPNIRKLFIEQGVRATRMHAELSQCCPGRASLLTGQHVLRHGVIRNQGDLLDPTTTINVALRASGYHTFIVGKYLNAYSGPKRIPGWDQVAMKESNSPFTEFFIDGRRKDRTNRFSDDVVRTRSIAWLRKAPADKPVFALVSPLAPHICPGYANLRSGCYYQPSVMERDQGDARCRGIADLKPSTYRTKTNEREVKFPMPQWRSGWRMVPTCESLLVVDRTVKGLVKAQRRRGRPAYFIFMSDNGMSYGQHGFTQKNAPTSTRMPFYINGPGIPRGEDLAVPISNADIAPTIAEAAGISFPSADGKSFLDGAKGDPMACGQVLMVRPSLGPKTYEGWSGIETCDWRYIRWDGGKTELYGTKRFMRRNVAKERPDVVATLEPLRQAAVAASSAPEDATSLAVELTTSQPASSPPA